MLEVHHGFRGAMVRLYDLRKGTTERLVWPVAGSTLFMVRQTKEMLYVYTGRVGSGCV